MSDIGENICKAVDQIINQRLSKINFNAAQTCKIINVDKAAQGIYTVSNQYTDFIAYSTDTTYNIDDVVYVLIPNNDMSEQKIILSKKIIEENGQPITYASPFNSMKIVNKNIIMDSISGSLLANDIDKAKILIWEDKSINSASGYTKLGLQALFSSTINKAVDGEYGLQLELLNNNNVIVNYKLSNEDMYGNPYNFQGFYQQQKVFDITDIGVFTGARLYFYQNNNFKDNEGKYINNIDTLGNPMLNNLFITDPQIVLGYDVNDKTHSGLIIYSEDDLEYNKTDNISMRGIKWRLLMNHNDGSIELIDSYNRIPLYEMYLYRYVPNAPATQYMGRNWEKIDSAKNFNEYFFYPGNENQSEKFRAVLTYNGEVKYSSNILEFVNLTDITSNIIREVINTLYINCTDKTDGVYYLYNINNVISKQSNATKTRTLKAQFITEEQKTEDIVQDAIEKIQWKLPREKTMFEFLVDDEHYLSLDDADSELQENLNTNGIWGYLDFYNNNKLEDGEEPYYWVSYKDYYYVQYENQNNKIKNTIKYHIKQNYNPIYNNNKVECTVYQDNKPRITSKDFSFGTMGMDANDCNFCITLPNNKMGLGLNEDSIIITADFYDSTNEKKLWGEEDDPITWYWYKQFKENGTPQTLGYIFGSKNVDNDGKSLLKNQTFVYKQDNKGKKFNENNYDVLVAEVEIQGYTYRAYYPIGLYDTEVCDGLSGETRITFSEDKKLQYNRDAYNLYKNINDEQQFIEDDNIKWEIKSTYDKTEKEEDGAENLVPDPYKPIIDDNNRLKPVVSIVNPEDLKGLYTIIAKKEDKILCEQPLVIYQTGLNSNATITSSKQNPIDLTYENETNKIKSSFYSVGKLGEDNDTTVYSGLIIGEIEATNSGDNNNYSGTGIYGFKDNKKTFAITQDGDAYFAGEIKCETGYIGKWKIDDTFTNTEDGNGLSLSVNGSNIDIAILTSIGNRPSDIAGNLWDYTINNGRDINNLNSSIISLNSSINTLGNNINTISNNIGTKPNNLTGTVWNNINTLNTKLNSYTERTIYSLEQNNNGSIDIGGTKYNLVSHVVLVKNT